VCQGLDGVVEGQGGEFLDVDLQWGLACAGSL
jgi:hypothetical protein